MFDGQRRAAAYARLFVFAFVLCIFYLHHNTLIFDTSQLTPGQVDNIVREQAQHTWMSSAYRFDYEEEQSIERPSDTPLSEDSREVNLSHVETVQSPNGCRNLPGAHKVMLILKTGATELYQKLPIHLTTTLECAPHSMIFSDLAQELGGHQIHDAVASVSKEVREQHPDFQLYRTIRQYHDESQQLSRLQGNSSWYLDKWKFMPIVHHAYEHADDGIDWFVMMEADTSLSWTNLLQWLRILDPRQPIYAGAMNLLYGVPFAHGGSGIIMSRPAFEKLENIRHQEGKETYDRRWELNTAASCCGDAVLSKAFREAGVGMVDVRPLIQGDTISSVEWNERNWCEPSISWHHVGSADIHGMWQFEQAWLLENGADKPYLYCDIFEYFVEPHVTGYRDHWNNLSGDRKLAAADVTTSEEEDVSFLGEVEKMAVQSEHACENACEQSGRDKCLQWMYSPGRCYLGTTLRFGYHDDRETGYWKSGWIQERVQRFKARLEDCPIYWPSWSDD